MKYLLMVFISILICANSLLAAPKEYKIQLNGKPITRNVLFHDKKIIFWALAKGNSSTPLNISLRAPKKVRLTVKAKHFKGSHHKARKQKRGWYKVLVKNQKQFDELQSRCTDIGFGEEDPLISEEIDIADFPPIEHPICDALDDEILLAISEQLSITYDGDWGIGNACSYIVNYYEGGFGDGELLPGLDETLPDASPTPAANEANLRFYKAKKFYGLLHKNACLHIKDSKYIVKFILDVSKIRAGISTISLSAKETRTYGGVKASSIKPVSEGRHAPSPLIMMNWLGSNCGDMINVVKWKKTKAKKKTELKIYSHLYYQDLVLALATADKVLKGGKGTFELYNGVHAYGVCFDLERRRQRAFGYPGSSID